MPLPASHFFILPDNRRLSYALYGPAGGKPVFYFHGTPSSRLEPLILNAHDRHLEGLLQHYGIRLIAVDRPGMGHSTFNPNKSFLSFGSDVAQLAAHLHITHAPVMGWSGAGVYALSFAWHHPQLVQGVYLVAAFTQSFSQQGVYKALHSNKYYFGAARYAPWLLQAAMRVASIRPASVALPRWMVGLPPVDYQYMSTPEAMRQLSMVTIGEACAAGSKGAVQEAALYFEPLDYQLAQIRQPIHYWWGTAERAIPRVHATAVEQQAPNASLYYKEGEGHFSIYIRYFEEVLATIAR